MPEVAAASISLRALAASRNSRRWPVGSLTRERWYQIAMTSSYRFRTQWRIAGTTADVRGVLDDVLSLPHWWPSVYLTVALQEEGGSDGC